MPLFPHDIPSRPWEIVMFDVIEPLPESDGKNAILVIADRFTKRIILEATTIKATSEDITIILRNQLF
jgi:hypothetical protein